MDRKLQNRRLHLDLYKKMNHYKWYINAIPKHTRDYHYHPSTPKVNANTSNRDFRAKCKAWRDRIKGVIKYYPIEEKVYEIELCNIYNY